MVRFGFNIIYQIYFLRRRRVLRADLRALRRDLRPLEALRDLRAPRRDFLRMERRLFLAPPAWLGITFP